MKLASCLVGAAVALAFAACADDAGDNLTPTAARTPDVTVVVRTTVGGPSADSTAPAPGAEVEVQGIVGAVDQANRSITINRLQGADVQTIEVGSATRITDARGGSVRLADIRPSDRVIARGAVDGRALLAVDVVVSQVVPGGAPGG